jgi:PD-(D/E)XK nuclease superfamily protein
MNSKNIGDISEAVIVAEFIKLGFSVSKPFGDNQPYDIIVDAHGKLFRIQIKTGRLKKGVILFNSISSINTRIEKKREKKTYFGKVDLFAIYCPQNEECYIVPIEEINKSMGTLRLESCKNGQNKNIKFAIDYKLSSNSLVEYQADTLEVDSSILS